MFRKVGTTTSDKVSISVLNKRDLALLLNPE